MPVPRLSTPRGLSPLHPLTAFQISQSSPARQGPCQNCHPHQGFRPPFRSSLSPLPLLPSPANSFTSLSSPAWLSPPYPLTAFQISQTSPARQGPYPPVIPSRAFALPSALRSRYCSCFLLLPITLFLSFRALARNLLTPSCPCLALLRRSSAPYFPALAIPPAFLPPSVEGGGVP